MSDAAKDLDHAVGPPSAFLREHASRLSATAGIGRTLDLACGRGRHALAASHLGLSVLAIDRNREHLDGLVKIRSDDITEGAGPIETRCADLESPPLPPLELESFGAILVFRYLHRPLFPWLQTLIAPGGILLYETFTEAQRALGWGPRRDAFLLKAGELQAAFPKLVVEVHEEGLSNDAHSAYTARLLASRPR